jgi:hypothetical protein
MTEAIGYSTDYAPNEQWEEQGLLCRWEHCIENMPYLAEDNPLRCPLFGHCCPGGVQEAISCGKTIDDVPANRFAPPEVVEAWIKEMGFHD